MSEYASPWIYGSLVTLKAVIPANSVIISLMVEVQENTTGTVTLQTEQIDAVTVSRIIFLDDITAKGIYAGNSVKDFFTSQQSIGVKMTGSLVIRVKILFWEAGI